MVAQKPAGVIYHQVLDKLTWDSVPQYPTWHEDRVTVGAQWDYCSEVYDAVPKPELYNVTNIINNNRARNHLVEMQRTVC